MILTLGLALAGVQVPVEGLLTAADGTPMNGTVQATFTLHDLASGGTDAYDETLALAVSDGRFAAVLGSSKTLPDSVFLSDRTLWLSVTVGGVSTSRVAIGAAPYAVRADRADTAALADAATLLGTYPASAFRLASDAIPWSSLDLDVGTPAGFGLVASNDTLSVNTTALDGRYARTGTAIQPLAASAAPHACDSATLAGTLYFDSTLGSLQVCNGSRWASLSDSVTGTVLAEISGATALSASGAVTAGWTAAGGELALANAATADLVVANGQTTTLPSGTHVYRNVTVQTGGTLTTDAWNGTQGGSLSLTVTGTFSVQSGATVNLRGKGYRGGTAISTRSSHGMSGESYTGLGVRTNCTRNGGGGGGGQTDAGNYGEAGGGASYGTVGAEGITRYTGCNSQAGLTYGDDDITVLHLGSGGGSAGTDGDKSGWGGDGGAGGGALRVDASQIVIAGTIDVRGADGGSYRVESDNGGGGGGSGGSVRLWANGLQIASTGVIDATGGAGGPHANANPGGIGGHGRIYVAGNTLTQSGTLNGTARKTVTGAGVPPLPALEGTYISPPINNATGGAPARVDVFLRNANRGAAVSICGASSSAEALSSTTCWRGVAPSGAVPTLPATAWLRVRVDVAGSDSSTSGVPSISGFRIVR